MAGKISKNDWRSPFSKRLEPLASQAFELEAFIYTGPFFVSCDHGCAHSKGEKIIVHDVDREIVHMEGRHGLLPPNGCSIEQLDDQITSSEHEYPSDRQRRKAIVGLCFGWIKNSTHMFARVDAEDAHGTLAEIGMAKAVGLKIHVSFDTRKRAKDAWFIAETADSSSIYPDTDFEIESYLTMIRDGIDPSRLT